jgi:CBS domain containing-hemolysin-like protein
MDLKAFYEMFNISSESESSTLAAWIIEQLGKVPEDDDEFDYENLKIKLVELDNHRVIKFECKVVELVEDSEEVSTNE